MNPVIVVTRIVCAVVIDAVFFLGAIYGMHAHAISETLGAAVITALILAKPQTARALSLTSSGTSTPPPPNSGTSALAALLVLSTHLFTKGN